MKNKFIMITLVLAIGLLSGYIGYDLIVVHKDNDKVADNNNNVEYDKHTVVVSAYDGIKTFHVKAENNCEGEDLNVTHVVSIPKIVKDTKNVKNFNNKILNEFKDEINFLNKENLIGEEISYGETSYDYTVVNDVVYIRIESSDNGFCRSGGTYITNYYYDLKNDKELTLKEVYNKNNITLNDIVNEFKSRYPEEKDYTPTGLYPLMPELSNDGYHIYLEDYGIDGLDLYLWK